MDVRTSKTDFTCPGIQLVLQSCTRTAGSLKLPHLLPRIAFRGKDGWACSFPGSAWPPLSSEGEGLTSRPLLTQHFVIEEVACSSHAPNSLLEALRMPSCCYLTEQRWSPDTRIEAGTGRRSTDNNLVISQGMRSKGWRRFGD